MWNWDNGIYPSEFKAKVVAWWILHNVIENHKADAMDRAMRRKSRSKGRR
jgi:hypothetical protein